MKKDTYNWTSTHRSLSFTERRFTSLHLARLRGKRGSFDFEDGLGVLGTARSARVVRQIPALMTK